MYEPFAPHKGDGCRHSSRCCSLCDRSCGGCCVCPRLLLLKQLASRRHPLLSLVLCYCELVFFSLLQLPPLPSSLVRRRHSRSSPLFHPWPLPPPTRRPLLTVTAEVAVAEWPGPLLVGPRTSRQPIRGRRQPRGWPPDCLLSTKGPITGPHPLRPFPYLRSLIVPLKELY